MKLRRLLSTHIRAGRIIKNSEVPSCTDCIYCKPAYYNNFSSELDRCQKFGEKDDVTDKIDFDFAEFARKDETKCGKEGKYFEKEPNLNTKYLKHGVIRSLPYIIVLVIVLGNVKYNVFR